MLVVNGGGVGGGAGELQFGINCPRRITQTKHIING